MKSGHDYNSNWIEVNAAQFKQVSKRQCKYGVSVKHNEAEIVRLTPMIKQCRTIYTPCENNPEGKVSLELTLTHSLNKLNVNLSDWVVVNTNTGTISVIKDADFAHIQVG